MADRPIWTDRKPARRDQLLPESCLRAQAAQRDLLLLLDAEEALELVDSLLERSLAFSFCGWRSHSFCSWWFS